MELALGLLVVGARLAVFAWAGSPLPYFDQWIVEFNNTFHLLLRGDSIVAALLTPHNEHVLVTTKLVTLAGFWLNGYWDVEFLAVGAAFVRGLEAALVFRLLSEGLSFAMRFWVWLACAITFVAPLSGYNALSGLQVAFYFADLAALASITCVVHWPSSAWRGGLLLVACMCAGLLSLGSAVAIPVATLGVHLLSRKARPGFFVAWAVTALAIVPYAIFRNELHTVEPTFVSLGTRMRFAVQVLSWPAASVPLGAAVIAAVLALLGRLYLRRQVNDPPCAAVIGFLVFAGTNAAMIGFFRAGEDFHMRHWDTTALVPLGLVALLAAWGHLNTARRSSRWLPAAALLALVGFLVPRIAFTTWPYLRSARERRAEALEYYRSVLTSERMMHEQREINTMLAAKDYSFFDDPIRRFAPHPVVINNIMRRPLPLLALLAPEILPVRAPSVVSRITDGIKSSGWLFTLAGIVCAVAGWGGLIRAERGSRAGAEGGKIPHDAGVPP